MTEIVGGNLEEITFHLISPQDLTYRQNELVNDLVERSITADYSDYPGVTPDRIQYFVDDSAEMRRNVGGRPRVVSELPRQAHGRDVSVLAISGDELLAYLFTADNTSSSLAKYVEKVLGKEAGDAIGDREALLKMRKNEFFVAKVWHRFGLRAVMPELLKQEGWGSDQMSVLDIMGYLSMKHKLGKQPTSTFSWECEREWVPTVESWGLRKREGSERPVYPFDNEAVPVEERVAVEQTRMTGDSVDNTRLYIRAKNDAEQILDMARVYDQIAA